MAFKKVGEDIGLIDKELQELKRELNNIKQIIQELKQTRPPTHKLENKASSTHMPANNYSIGPLKYQNILYSIGNEGVPTDRQTHRQTHQQTQNLIKKEENSINNAIEILDSLDSLKREIRLKFKKLTAQEVLVFSTLYQLDEELGSTDYKTLSKKLNLTESSIRDYIGRLIKKGIPVEKNKINNKNIRLSISSNLKKIATLHTILQLRDL